jgi:predicted nucleotidyltransferase
MVLPVSTLDDLVRRITAVEAEIRSLGVRRLPVFGSVARGTVTPDSDADVLVQFATGAKTFNRFMALSDLLEDRLGRRVELVTTEALSPYLGPRILAEARDALSTA